MSRRAWMWIIVVALLAVAAIATWLLSRTYYPFPPDPADHLARWQLSVPQDIASSSPRLTATIATLEGQVGKGQYPDADIYVGIANTYALMGNGRSAYNYYERAIEASSTYALAYEDLAALFALLHATSSAEEAYAKAVALEPAQVFYQISALEWRAIAHPAERGAIEAQIRRLQQP